MQCSKSSKALLCYTVDRQLMNVNPLLTKSNQTFGRNMGKSLAVFRILNFSDLKQNKKTERN